MVRNFDLNALPDENGQPEVSDTPSDLQHEHPPSSSGSGPVPSATDADAIDNEAAFQTPPEWRAPRRRRTPRILIGEIVRTNAESSGAAVEERMRKLCPDCFESEGGSVQGPVQIVCPDCCELAPSNDGVPTVRKTIQFLPEKEIESSSSCSPEPDENALICAVCMRKVNDPSSTTCGHVFCTKCIEDTVARLKKCPTCRKRLTKSSFHKIFLQNG
ncbi:E3 ubiquitin-protein ligase BRE1-like [Phalaenopsis equestris]|uniref:E3 ubiquitin-protein ligase BRE1-like n=1 Tax=Phalaenopsis equestris TaxID=78828 RepID=UPI0009E2E824|nr:E3 ubiquitin-protein ligase BRE1-like [Phalaenopsis equestris]